MAIELALEVLPVLLDRGQADPELVGNLLVHAADCEQLEDFAFASGQTSQTRPCAYVTFGACSQARKQSTCDLGRDVGLAAMDRPDGEGEFGGIGVLG